MTKETRAYIQHIFETYKNLSPDFAKNELLHSFHNDPPSETCEHIAKSIMYGLIKGTEIDGRPFDEVVRQIAQNLGHVIHESHLNPGRLERLLISTIMLLGLAKLQAEKNDENFITTQE